MAGGRRAVITKLVFDAAASKTNESDRWTQAWMTSYEPRAFATLCDALFGAGGGPVPERVDLSVRVTSAAYSMMLIIVRATGHGDADGKAAETLVQAALNRAKLPSSTPIGCRRLQRCRLGGDGPKRRRRRGPEAVRQQRAPRRSPGSGKSSSMPSTSPSASAPAPAASVPRYPGLGRSSSSAGGGVVARADFRPEGRAERRAGRAAAHGCGHPCRQGLAYGRGRSRALIRRAAAGCPTRRRGLAGLAPTPGFDLVSSNRAGSNKIPGFEGEVFDQSDGRSYRRAINQYAVSSYSSQVVDARMTPRLVAKAENAMDVARAVTFAAQHDLKVVTRSGGHQYCGLSSGGKDTLLLDMTLFTKVLFSPSTGTPTQVTVGPGVALKDVSKMLLKRGVVIPHGECPLVRLGGHVQTGGIGHQLRSLGATLDWVRSFKMVTRDPRSPGADVYVEREFTRPRAGSGTGAPTDSDVFSAVLGGGPSSWGVLTEISFDLVLDSQYPASEGYSYTYLYVFGKEGFRAAMEQLRRWAEREAAGKLSPGIDLFLTVVSGDFYQFRPARAARGDHVQGQGRRAGSEGRRGSGSESHPVGAPFPPINGPASSLLPSPTPASARSVCSACQRAAASSTCRIRSRSTSRRRRSRRTSVTVSSTSSMRSTSTMA